MLLKRALRHRLSKKVLSFMTGTAIAGFLTLPILTATVLTLPFTLPILAAVATVTATAILDVCCLGLSRAKRMPTEANNTYLAALKSLNVGLNCDIDDNGCQEGKDRTGAVMMMREALMVFYEQKGRLPQIKDRNYLFTVSNIVLVAIAVTVVAMVIIGLPITGPILLGTVALGALSIGMRIAANNIHSNDTKELGEILSQVINADHDARAAGRNTKGGVGMKNLPDYIPKQFYET